MNEIEEFCKKYNVTEDQYYGKTYFDYTSGGICFVFNNLIHIPYGFNPKFSTDHLLLKPIEYWPKWFKPQVRGWILIDDLKSPTLKKLIENPKTRQLAYNLLDNL